jgi:poly(beta-D-mannuronate) lyase
MTKKLIIISWALLQFIFIVTPAQAITATLNTVLQNERLVKSSIELDAAVKNAVPGDVIVMQNGTWKNIDILFKGKGTASKPITLKAETPGKVIISGASSLRISGEYLVVDGLHFKEGYSSKNLHLIEFRDKGVNAKHCRITNIAVSAFNKDRSLGSDVWVGLFGTHNQVDHCLFQGKTSESVLIVVWRSTAEPNYHRINNNHFLDMPSIGLGGATAIRIGDGVNALSPSHTTVESNIFENMLGIGKIISMKSGGNFIRNNKFIKASGSICIRQGNGNLIEGNYILPGLKDNYTGGILVIGEDHIIRNNYIQGTREKGKAAILLYEGQADNAPGKGGYYPTKNITISNNTLVDNDMNIVIGQLYNPKLNITVPVENVIFKENVVVGNNHSAPMIKILDKPKGEVKFQGNVFYQGNLEGLENLSGIMIKDPKLQADEDGIYQYAKDSPLKNNLIPPVQRKEVGPQWMK